ncbi:MAG: 50S ribosomal protein L10 [Verrucomicrobia bacterium GWC2_42_7]|nr:MAG: 50S ribosomal protein L10 [Verrucomicrobia bacterium GWC2_42_7]
MRPEKNYLVKEVSEHLEKSDYLFLANFDKVTVLNTAELRAALAKECAEYHVVKNSILNVAAKEKDLPDLTVFLNGSTAIVVGGKNPSGVAKILVDFAKSKDRLAVKGGAIGKNRLGANDVETLAKLPCLEVLRAQFLGLLNQPAQQFLYVLQGVPQGLLNVLKAHSEKA